MVAERDETNLGLVFHPAEQAAHFSLGNDEIVCAARTSNGGPGYHVYIVEFLRHLERQCGLNWVEDEESGEVDETNYFSSGDFQDVLAQMDGWLKLNLSHVAETLKDMEALAVGIPTHLASAKFEPGKVLTSLGPVDVRTIVHSADLDNEEFRSFANDWYVWPSSGIDLAFWERTSNALLWCEVPWHPPFNDDDEWSYRAVRHALEQFKNAGGDAQLFKVEEAEIAQMVASIDSDDLPVPFPDGRGYRRRRLDRPLQDLWIIQIPGHWYFEQTDDDAAYWYSNMTVRSSLLTVKSDTDRRAIEILTKIVEEEASENSKTLQMERIVDNDFVGFIQDVDDPGDANFGLLGQYANDNSILTVSCYFDAKAETAKAWDYLRSVRYSGAPPELLFIGEDGELERKLN